MYKSIILFVSLLVIKKAWTLEEGESCMKDGALGKCAMLKNCQAAIDDIRNQRRPQHCTFSGREPIVCCVSTQKATTARPPVATTPKKSSTTKKYVPAEYDYSDNGGGACAPISPSLTSKKNGIKSWDKCLDYQEQLVYPCTSGVQLTGEPARSSRCGHETDELIVGGTSASKDEFPHMALLGYGEVEDNLWLCGGTLISERFILTAGHCISYRKMDVSLVAVGVYKRSTLAPDQIYNVEKIIPHPEFKPPLKYNDIALLKTKNDIKLSQFAVPACLPAAVAGAGRDERALASGWGAVEYRGDLADILQKVIITKFTNDECAAKFPAFRLMPQGFDTKTQICYGDKTKSKDTCQGDSGGPLQIRNKLIHCMYTVIGVTSFGKACGFVGDPGIYTRVAAYMPWIEATVWPN